MLRLQVARLRGFDESQASPLVTKFEASTSHRITSFDLSGVARRRFESRFWPILRGPSGKPLHLDNMARREIRPALKAAGIPWQGWYALRRGIATLLNSIEKDQMAAKGLLRHTSVITTQKHYIKEVPATTLAAMKKIEALCDQLAPEGEVLPA